MSDQLLDALDPGVAAVLRGLPAGWLDDFGPEDAFLLGPQVAAALRRAADEQDGSPGAWGWQVLMSRCVPGTPFAGIRMEAQAGPVCAVASPGTASDWYSWLPLGALTARPATAPLLLVVHDVDRRARELRDALGPWAEGAGCFVLAPEFLVDPRAPEGDLAYATGPRAAQAALTLLDELTEAVGVAFPQVVVLAVGSGAALVPALLRDAPERLAGGVLVSPDSASVLPVVGEAALPAAGSVPLVVLGGGSDTTRPSGGAPGQTGLGDARRVAAALGRAGLDVRLEVVPDSGGQLLHQRADAVVLPHRPTAMAQAATTAVSALVAGPGPVQ